MCVLYSSIIDTSEEGLVASPHPSPVSSTLPPPRSAQPALLYSHTYSIFHVLFYRPSPIPSHPIPSSLILSYHIPSHLILFSSPSHPILSSISYPIPPSFSSRIPSSFSSSIPSHPIFAITGSSVFYRPKDKAVHADNAKLNFARGGGGDHLALLR